MDFIIFDIFDENVFLHKGQRRLFNAFQCVFLMLLIAICEFTIVQWNIEY